MVRKGAVNATQGGFAVKVSSNLVFTGYGNEHVNMRGKRVASASYESRKLELVLVMVLQKGTRCNGRSAEKAVVVRCC
jgi:hypothetical protein